VFPRRHGRCCRTLGRCPVTRPHKVTAAGDLLRCIWRLAHNNTGPNTWLNMPKCADDGHLFMQSCSRSALLSPSMTNMRCAWIRACNRGNAVQTSRLRRQMLCGAQQLISQGTFLRALMIDCRANFKRQIRCWLNAGCVLSRSGSFTNFPTVSVDKLQSNCFNMAGRKWCVTACLMLPIHAS
jgi:hypothetical protein